MNKIILDLGTLPTPALQLNSNPDAAMEARLHGRPEI